MYEARHKKETFKDCSEPIQVHSRTSLLFRHFPDLDKTEKKIQDF